MKIIELTETQFKNYSKLHSSRNYFQTIEYANIMNNYNRLFLGFINENDNTIMGAVLLLERSVLKFKVGVGIGVVSTDPVIACNVSKSDPVTETFSDFDPSATWLLKCSS